MEKIPQNILKEKGKDDPNFHEIAESRREIKKIMMESDGIGAKYYENLYLILKNKRPNLR